LGKRKIVAGETVEEESNREKERGREVQERQRERQRTKWRIGQRQMRVV
jgi:hypothetical protein